MRLALKVVEMLRLNHGKLDNFLNDLTEAQKAHDKVLENHSKVLNDVTKANAMAAEQGYDKQLIKQAEAARGFKRAVGEDEAGRY
jgi:hypothetical protein